MLYCTFFLFWKLILKFSFAIVMSTRRGNGKHNWPTTTKMVTFMMPALVICLVDQSLLLLWCQDQVATILQVLMTIIPVVKGMNWMIHTRSATFLSSHSLLHEQPFKNGSFKVKHLHNTTVLPIWLCQILTGLRHITIPDLRRRYVILVLIASWLIIWREFSDAWSGSLLTEVGVSLGWRRNLKCVLSGMGEV